MTLLAPSTGRSYTWGLAHLVSVRDLKAGDVEALFALAHWLSQHPGPTLPADLQPADKACPPPVWALCFAEASTRTQSAFQLAVQRLGLPALTLNLDTSSTQKGESLRDTARNLEALGLGGLIVRHPRAGAAHYLSQQLHLPIINAGDGAHEHPTQALLDAYTLHRRWGGQLRDKRVVFVGDIRFSRVARSGMWLFAHLGAHVGAVGPAPLLPAAALQQQGIDVYHDLPTALAQADAVICLRLQKERQDQGFLPPLGEYTRYFGLQAAQLGLLKPGAYLLHPGPINRGVELCDTLADDPQRSLVLEQVAQGVWVRMAALALCRAKASKGSEPLYFTLPNAPYAS
jgi:aspartate carbamoyltransferase catalytic subunit